MNEFCSTLRERRQRVGLSQRKLAELTGLSLETIGYIERGKTRKPYNYTMNAINKVIEETGRAKLRVLTETKK